MPFVLTTASTVQCTHQGKVQLLASQTKLKVGGASVLVLGDLSGKPVAGCTTVADPMTATVTCAATQPPPAGSSSRLKVGGKPVLLETASGLTSGTVGGAPQSWSVQAAGQTQLKSP